MYKCPDCGKTFDEPKYLSESYEYQGAVFNEYRYCCPYCCGWGFEEFDPFDEIEEEEE